MSKRDSFGMAAQADFDTAAAAVAYSPPVNEVEADFDREDMEDEETLGGRAPVAMEYGGRIYKPQASGSIRPNSIGLILAAYFGPPVSTQPDATAAPNVWQHVFDPMAAGVLPLPVSAWLLYGDITHGDGSAVIDKFEQGIGNSLELSVEANNYYKFQAEYFFRKLITNAADPSMNRDAGRKFPFTKVGVEFAPIGGVYEATPARNYTLAYSNELVDDQFVLGSDLVDSIPLGPTIEPELTFTPTRDIAAHNRRALANEPESMKMRVNATGPQIAEGFNYGIATELHKLQTMTAPLKLDGSETLREVEVTAKPVLDEDSNKFITVTLTNTENGDKYRAAAA